MTGSPAGSRDEQLRRLEGEVGVLIRRIRKVIHERARAVHEDMQPTSYLLLAWLKVRNTQECNDATGCRVENEFCQVDAHLLHWGRPIVAD